MAEGKDYGLIVDYYGNLENLDKAIEIYSGSDEMNPEDVKGSVTNVKDIIKDLPQSHSGQKIQRCFRVKFQQK